MLFLTSVKDFNASSFSQVGCTLTGVGELILDSDRTLALRPPSDGSEYFLSAADFDTLRAEQVREAVAWQVLASVFALAGAAVLFWVGRRYYCKLKVRWEQERQRREFQRLQGDDPRLRTASAGSDTSEDGGPVENSCVICLSQPRECVLLNCGHVCCCLRCYQALPQPTCPICRQTINRVVPIYQAWRQLCDPMTSVELKYWTNTVFCTSCTLQSSKPLHLHFRTDKDNHLEVKYWTSEDFQYFKDHVLTKWLLQLCFSEIVFFYLKLNMRKSKCTIEIFIFLHVCSVPYFVFCMECL